mgnify:CR=1 FL=1
MIDLRAQVRPDERRLVYGAAVTLFGILTGHALLEIGRASCRERVYTKV